MMKTKGNKMNAPENTVSTEVAISSAAEWMKQLSKKYGIKGAIDKWSDRIYLGDSFGANTFGGQRITKFENLFNFVNDGFKNSKRWVAQDGNSYARSEFISIDGRFKVVVYNKYNGLGGWKVAVKHIGISIFDLAAK
jgi:hypothetical protein